MSLDVSSWAFQLEDIPLDYTADGKNVSPPLAWSRGPGATKTYALIMDDPDGPRGSWVHWIVWNIRDTKLHRNIPKQPVFETAFGAIRQGRNSFNRVGYSGPCPPSGTHRYFFKVFALDTELDLPAEANRKRLRAAIRDHVLDEGELMVTYSHARGVDARRRMDAALIPRPPAPEAPGPRRPTDLLGAMLAPGDSFRLRR